jgi:hypothetical protein
VSAKGRGPSQSVCPVGTWVQVVAQPWLVLELPRLGTPSVWRTRPVDECANRLALHEGGMREALHATRTAIR